MKRLLMALWLLLCLPLAAMASDSGCRSCHAKLLSPMPPPGKGAPLDCTWCHKGDGLARKLPAGHQGLIANPSALDRAPAICGRCHAPWPQRVRRSPMATAMGVINQTRFLWGAQASLKPRYAVRAEGPLAALPLKKPVDDLLRRRCLRCHLWSKGADLAGARRSAGCAACHRPYGSQGRRPKVHGLTSKVPMRQCLTCHAGCGAGPEYSGRVARDATAAARFLAPERGKARLWQGRVWRPMQPDLHHKAGLTCQDCHPQSEIMGDGMIRPAGLLQVGVRCTTCHGRPGQPPAAGKVRTSHGAVLKHVQVEGNKVSLIGRLSGRRLAVPLLAGGDKEPVAHQAPGHQKLACHACHSAYNPAVWGLMVMRETLPRYRAWQRIAAQGDPQLLKLLAAELAKPPGRRRPPQSRDWLSGEKRPGIWLASPFFRRFRWRVYGKGPQGRTFLLSPRFAYVLTLLDQKGRTRAAAQLPRTTDGRQALGITPWHSHSTARAAPACGGCHGSARALGLGLTFRLPAQKGQPLRLAPRLWRSAAEGLPPGLDWTQVVNLAGQRRQVFLVPGSGPYPAADLRRLLVPRKKYKRWLLKALEEEWPFSAKGPGG